MSILVDTNILLRVAQRASPHHLIAKSAVLLLVEADVTLCIVPQVIYEFWVAATRPLEVNGLGLSIDAAQQSIQAMIQDYQLLKDERGIFGHWHSLVVDYQVMGKTAHYARIVAAMTRHGLTNLLTFNKPDFTRFPEIRVFTPADIMQGQVPAPN
jgi:predicted nucleic acid-binding protein